MNQAQIDELKAEFTKENSELTAVLLKELTKTISRDYFMVRRNKWWAFLGGIFAFIIAVGFVSYAAAVIAAAQPGVKAAVNQTYVARDQCLKDLGDCNQAKTDSEKALAQSQAFPNRLDAVDQGLNAQKAAIVLLSTWQTNVAPTLDAFDFKLGGANAVYLHTDKGKPDDIRFGFEGCMVDNEPNINIYRPPFKEKKDLFLNMQIMKDPAWMKGFPDPDPNKPKP